MNKIYLFLVFALAYQTLAAQFVINGYVVDSETKSALADVAIAIENTTIGTYTDQKGYFELEYSIENPEISAYIIGYQKLIFDYSQNNISNSTLNFKGKIPVFELISQIQELSEAVIVSSTRINDEEIKTAITLKKNELQKINVGQDLPILLNVTPSLVYTSDAGNGIGYTQFRIRGMDLTRINVTVNGVPINDQESQGVWWVNMPDMASSINSIQIQRGVGTSTNGGQAFGSSVNIETKKIGLEPMAQLSSSIGSFNSYKTTAEFSTGILENNWGFTGRLSKIYSDGYIDRAFSDMKSYYIAAHYTTEKQSIRITTFSGIEKTYQAWYGVSQNDLINNRTKNYYDYKNQTDNYQQDHLQIHYTRKLGKIKANAALHYTAGRGFYEEFRPQEPFSYYGLNNIQIGDTLIKSGDFVRQRWLKNKFIGGIYSLERKTKLNEKTDITLTLGGNYNQYFGKHFGKIVWSQFASNSFIGNEYYINDAFKSNTNNYLKTQLKNDLWMLQGEIQWRLVNYNFIGIDDDLSPLEHQVVYSFINPKLMASYHITNDINIYGYYGKSSREPLRTDFTEVEPSKWPNFETVHDFEMGFNASLGKTNVNTNFYYMYFLNQLVQNGQINDVGAYLRVNVPHSFRRGIEIELSTKIAKSIRWSGNLTLSQNKIKQWTAFIEQYDENFNFLGQREEIFNNCSISFSPNIIGVSSFDFSINKNISAVLQSKFVGRQYLDNTQNNERKLNDYLVNDLFINYTIFEGEYFKTVKIQAVAYNFMNELYESNGYTWLYDFAGNTSFENYYYPQAGRNFMLGLILGF